jgi:hypothetical protein
VIVVASAIAADWPASRHDGASAQLESLLKERRDVVRKLVEIVNRRYQTGMVTQESVILASNLLLDAELELARTKAERIAVCQKLVGNLRQLEQAAEARHERTMGSADDVLKAKAARLKAEIQLVRENAEDM